MDKEVEAIMLLGKDSIIKLAIKNIESLVGKEVELKNFTKIELQTNGKDVLVSFYNPIKYLPQKSVFYFGVNVFLLEKSVRYNSPIANPPDYNEKRMSFYNETKTAKNNIQFVIEALNNNNYFGLIDITNFDDDMVIREYEDHFHVFLALKFHETECKIDKISGKTYNTVDYTIEPMPIEFQDEDVYQNIIWNEDIEED